MENEKFKYVPHIDEYGDLVIPFLSHPCFHWWTEGGITVEDTLQEIERNNWKKPLKPKAPRPVFDFSKAPVEDKVSFNANGKHIDGGEKKYRTRKPKQMVRMNYVEKSYSLEFDENT